MSKERYIDDKCCPPNMASRPKVARDSQEKMLSILSKSDYIERYMQFCAQFGTDCDISGPRLNLDQTCSLFHAAGVRVHFNRRFKLFTFDWCEAAGWTWYGKLLVQRYDVLEPMFDGSNSEHSAGSTLLHLAINAGDIRNPPKPRADFLPPHVNRPRFDGDMATMARMIPELVALIRWTRGLIAREW